MKKLLIVAMMLMVVGMWSQYGWTGQPSEIDKELFKALADSTSSLDIEYFTPMRIHPDYVTNLSEPLDLSEGYRENEYLWTLLLFAYSEYEQECYTDTIKATLFVEGAIIEYIIPLANTFIKEMVTEKQLKDRGYEYRYRWIDKVDSSGDFDIEYIFTKEPSLKGFMEFLRKKTKEEKDE